MRELFFGPPASRAGLLSSFRDNIEQCWSVMRVRNARQKQRCAADADGVAQVRSSLGAQRGIGALCACASVLLSGRMERRLRSRVPAGVRNGGRDNPGAAIERWRESLPGYPHMSM